MSKFSPTTRVIPSECEVLIVGGGVAGATSAYILAMKGVKNIVVLEAGDCGYGASTVKEKPDYVQYCTDEEEVAFPHADRSGSAVMKSANAIKMMVRLYASTSADFILHHGKEGARRYLSLTKEGIELQKSLAAKVLENKDNIRHFGSLYLAYEDDEADLREEYNTLRELGCDDISWVSKEELTSSTPSDDSAPCAFTGVPSAFHCGISFPNDAIIDSQAYAASLIRAAVATGNVSLFENAPKVTSVSTVEDGLSAMTRLIDGTTVTSQHIVLATGGLFAEPGLAGIMRPCWSYLVALQHPTLKAAKDGEKSVDNQITMKTSPFGTFPALNGTGAAFNSQNMFTWRFTHDWSWTNGAVRVSGEDHFSAFKAPREKERCHNLASWVKACYPDVWPSLTSNSSSHNSDSSIESRSRSNAETTDESGETEHEYPTQYGVYSETPDAVPLIGQTHPGSRICYLLGCNAWGQAVMTYSASLVPALLGYEVMSPEQQDKMELLTIKRFSLLPMVQAGK